MHAATSIPQPPLRPLVGPLVGNAPDVGTETPVQSFMRLAEQYGPLFRITFPSRSVLVVSSHALVDELSDESRFDKRVHGPLQHIRDFAGDGLFTAETGEPNWARAHRLLTPAFGPAAMKGYFEPMLDVAQQMVDKWARLGPSADIDVPDNMTRLTLDTIALSGFDYRFNSFYQREMHPFVGAMVRALGEAGARAKQLPLQTRLRLVSNNRYQRDIAYMQQLVDEVIRARKAAGPSTGSRDLLGLMLEASDPRTGDRLDDLNIRHQIVTFLIAGHETTSGLLSFTTYLLLKHPEVMARAREEIDSVLGGRTPRFDDLRKLTYLDQILRESLRLWPTAPAFAVRPLEHTTIGDGYPVTPDDTLLILTPQLHRDPAVWEDPARFDPSRFAPGSVENIPPNAWKPFGNGQRACIGRQFAMQEATLVLAMMLQRFELVDAHDYQLKVKETLTLKPDGLTIRVRRRAPVELVETTPEPADTVAATPRAHHGTPLRVLFGSNSGSSEAFARRIATDAERRGYDARVTPLDDAVDDLPTAGAYVMVTASYNGHPPDNARAFCAWLDTLQPRELEGVRYAVFGCGSRDWAATYQAVPTRIDEAMAAAGASRLMPRGEADARADFFGDFDEWYGGVWPTVDEALGVDVEALDDAPALSVEVLPAGSDPRLRGSELALATVTRNRELVDTSSPFGRDKREITLRLPEGMRYRAGDHLEVLGENPPVLVERALSRMQLDPSDRLVIRQHGPGADGLPLDEPITAEALFRHHVELSQPATRRDIDVLLEHTLCPPEKARLAHLRSDEAYASEVLEKRLTVLALLTRFPSCELPLPALLSLLPAMKPRRYSISSSPRVDPSRCTLTVAVVRAPAWCGEGEFEGVASTTLSRLEPGESVPVAVRSPHAPFFPPEDLLAPILMIAAGTGMAPFRGFLEERAARADAQERFGDAALFFGCDHPDVDLLYRGELERWSARGLVELHTAYFRQPEGEIHFVQHRLWAERERVNDLLDAGARVYLCGDGRHMAPAVRDTLCRIHQHRHGGTDDDATHWLREMEREGRYLADVFAG